jgi:hypothetical protein
VEKIVNEILALVVRHLVPFQAVLSADASQLPLRILHPLVASLRGTRCQGH